MRDARSCQNKRDFGKIQIDDQYHDCEGCPANPTPHMSPMTESSWSKTETLTASGQWANTKGLQ